MKTGRRTYLFAVLALVLAAAGLYGLLPQLGHFGDSLQALRSANPMMAILAAMASLVAVVWAAIVYIQLAYRRLSFGDTVLVQYAGLFINRVLPVGIGGLGLNFVFLRAHKHTATQAGTVVALNNLLGIIAHLLLAIVILAWYIIISDTRPIPHVSNHQIVLGVVVLVGLLGLAAVTWLLVGGVMRRRLADSLRLLARFYARRPRQLGMAMGVAALLTISNVCSFWLSCQAVGVHIGIAAAFLVFTFGVALATATPTPGGIGGAEAGLVGGLLTQHATASAALAAALLYRLVSFWLGLIVGAAILPILRSRQLLRR